MSTKSLTPQEYTIREAAQLSGLPESTLRYYEAIGLIQPIGRDSSSGHRRYSESDLNVITSIACLNATGMPLESMRTYIENSSSGARASNEQIALLEAQKKHLLAEEEQLKVRQEYVGLKIKYWQAVKTGDQEKALTIAKKAGSLAKELTSKK